MQDNLSMDILSEVTVYLKYARYLPELKRRETWEEIVTRNMMMHIKKYPQLAEEIGQAYQLVFEKKVLPSMRALEDSTPIITKDGWKKAVEIKRGDILYSSSGNETTVLDTIHFKNKQLYEIEFSDHSKLTACSEHLWSIKTLDDLKYDKPCRVVDTLFLKEHILQGNKHNIHIENPKPLKRPNIDLELDPYILGHWLGDGYSAGYQYSTSIEDSSFFKEQYEKQGFNTRQSTSSNVWTWFAHGLATQLKKLNLVKNKHIPEKYLRSSFEQRLSLIQGLMDSDGHVTPEGRCLFFNTNPLILSGFKELISSLGIKYTESEKKILKEHHKQGTTISFFTTIPIVRLPRKRNNIRKELINERTQYRIVFSVVEIEKGDASCFHVDSDDHTFLAGEKMIVTHNSLQFAGKAIETNNSRLFNCSYLPIDDPYAFPEIMFLLLGGTGVGYSVQQHHIEKLPAIKKPTKFKRRYLVDDSIEGWSLATWALFKAYFRGLSSPIFDYSVIRPKGSPLKTAGGRAPGPEPLKKCLDQVRSILDKKDNGEQLTSLEVHDIICFLSDAVLAGGIRRSALISLFSVDDEEMLKCKHGDWWKENGQRARANNSVVLLRHRIKKEEFGDLWKTIRESNSGEPGIFFSNNSDVGTNPCCEISLKPHQFCNLTTINASNVSSQEDFNERARVASFIGTLQASYTDFHFLRDIWKKTSDKENLLGVSLTGIASGNVLKLDLHEAAETVKKENERVAKLIGINKAARLTCTKPEGTSSLALGTSSGIHAWHAPYYIRRVRVLKNEPIYTYLKQNLPDLVEDDVMKPDRDAVISFPVKAPEGATFRDESALHLLERVKQVSIGWVKNGHRKGDNTHNVSATVSVKLDEWENVGEWMWENRNIYNGLSVLPFDEKDNSYQQMPFEEITELEYRRLLKYIKKLDLTNVTEEQDNTSLKESVACAGGACEVSL